MLDQGLVIRCVSLQMSAVGLTENVKGDVRKFELWYSGREVVYVVQVSISRPSCLRPPGLGGLACVLSSVCLCLIQAPTVEVKVTWLTEIRKVLTNQLKVQQGLGSGALVNVGHVVFL